MDSSGDIACASSTSALPQYTLTNNTSDTSVPAFVQQKSRAGPAAVQTNDGLGAFYFYGYANGGYNLAAYMKSSVTGVSGSNVAANFVVVNFDTGGAGHQSTFDASGNFTAAGSLSATLANSTAAQSGYVCYNSGSKLITYDNTNTCLASSRLFKNLEQYIEPDLALRDILRMRPLIYTYKTDEWPELPNGKQEGFFAEDVAEVDQILVSKFSDDRPRSVKYEQMTAKLVGAIQALKSDNDNLRAEIRRRVQP